ncbi:MAG: CBS domain-containing protein [Gaiellales bacterium]
MMKVSDVMRREIVTVAPETSLRDVAAVLSERGISGVPVVEGDAVLGIVSETDVLMKERTPAPKPEGLLARLLGPRDPEAEAKLAARTASEAMSSPAVTIEPGVSVPKAAALMVEHAVNRLPVVENGALVGIVTRADLVRAFTRDDAAIRQEVEHEVVVKQFWLPPGSVHVQVANGEVTLGGTVEKRSIAELLASVVERVPGVVSVTSRMSWQEDDRT